jgi:16S rRNA processing protein RimM
MVILGRVSGVFGVRGWVRVFSHTTPRDGILRYSPWHLRRGERWVRYQPLDGAAHGKGLVVRLQGCEDRDQAAALRGAEIAVRRDQLPDPGPDEFYWSDLEGLEVRTRDGVVLGRLDYLFETGANDVMVVRGERERLIPYLWGQVVDSVDLTDRVMVVDWDPEF